MMNLGIEYAFIIEHEGKFYIWYRDVDGYIAETSNTQLFSKIRAVLSEPGGDRDLLNQHVAEWMVANKVEEIGGYAMPKEAREIDPQKRIQDLEFAVYRLADRLKKTTRERDALFSYNKERSRSDYESALVIAAHLMQRVLPLEVVIACAIQHQQCRHIVSACRDHLDIIGDGFEQWLSSVAGH